MSAASFDFGIAGAGILTDTSAESLPAKVQGGLGFWMTGTLHIIDSVGPGVGLFFADTSVSDASGGFIYRGYSELGLCAFVEGRGIIKTWEGLGTLRVGGDAGVSGSIATYSNTGLSFFFPSVDVTPFAIWTPWTYPTIDLRAAIPVRVIFRSDVTWSVSAGLALEVRFVLGRNSSPQESF